MHIYHEKQQGNFCALHAINGLLQAPLYCLEFLISISQNLDEMELSLMESPNNFQSQNMDNSGNFSIQVIIEALAPYGLQLIRFFSSDPRAISARHNTCNEEAFICHRNKNWFTYRKIGDTWYYLNSMNSTPQQIKVNGTQLYPFSKPEFIDSFTDIFIVVAGNVHKEATDNVDGSRDINELCDDL